MRVVAAVAVCVGLTITAHAQEVAFSELKFNSGQSVQPAYEGWTRNPDGSRSMWFGYLNRNWEETPDIAAGVGNGFGAGSEDLGQPTHFLPRRQAFVFKVNVPADWPVDKDLVWTLTANGTTLKAFGSLWPVWQIDEYTMSANNGGRTARTFGEPVNLPPAIVSQLPSQTVAVGQPLTLVLPVKDDGLPTPEIRARGTGGPRGRVTPPNAAAPDPFAEAARVQFRVKWVQYRGAGNARITPEESAVLGADGRATLTEGKSSTKVTFDRAGTYTLRAYA
ncbi:MAG: hypothetical protein ABIS29_18875, partial [Vicinamibacterales bacterium]